MDEQVMLRYMQAYLRLYVAHDMSGWTKSELVETFCTLPRPRMQPDEWLQRCGFTVQEQQETPDSNAARMGMKIMSWAASHKASFPKTQETACPPA